MRKLALLFMLNLCIVAIVRAQSPTILNPDSVYHQARNQAYQKNYDQSLKLLEPLVREYPDNIDYLLLEASVMAWKKDYSAALNKVDFILKKDRNRQDVYLLKSRILWWSEENEKALSVIEQGIKSGTEDKNLLELKMKIYSSMGNVEQATQVAQQLGVKPPSVESVSLVSSYANVDYRTMIAYEYQFEGFNTPYHRRWHMMALGYGKKTSYGDFWAKIYTGDIVASGERLFSNGTGLQYALELYPRIDLKNYFYVNLAWSNSTNFPHLHGGFEFYHAFGNGLEASLGYRYFRFEPVGGSVNVHLFTGSVALYEGTYWFSLRPFWIHTPDGNSFRGALTIRNYPSGNENYYELSLSSGNEPDNPSFYTSSETVARLSNWRIGLGGKSRIISWLFVQGGVSWEWSEYRSSDWRQQLGITASLIYVF